MQKEQEVKQRRPFHETIIEAIRHASSNEMVCLAELIKATKIPKGHEEIIVAWMQRLQEIGYPNFNLDVTADLLEQKQEAEKKEEEKKAKEQAGSTIS